MTPITRKSTICICENKDADQLRGNREADQRFYFSNTDSTISLLCIYIQNFHPLTIFCAFAAQLVSDLFENHIVVFPMRWLICLLGDKFMDGLNQNWSNTPIWAATREKRSSGFPTWSDTNRALQVQKMATGWKFWI